MTPNLLFWPGNDVVTFVIQKGEDFTVTVVPPARFMDGLMTANALLTQGDFGPDEATLQGVSTLQGLSKVKAKGR